MPALIARERIRTYVRPSVPTSGSSRMECDSTSRSKSYESPTPKVRLRHSFRTLRRSWSTLACSGPCVIAPELLIRLLRRVSLTHLVVALCCRAMLTRSVITEDDARTPSLGRLPFLTWRSSLDRLVCLLRT